VLARGWTITRRADGRIIRSPDELDVDDVLITQFATGTSRSRVVPAPEDPDR
jgi:exonuclease VII large subunit